MIECVWTYFGLFVGERETRVRRSSNLERPRFLKELTFEKEIHTGLLIQGRTREHLCMCVCMISMINKERRNALKRTGVR